MTSTYEEALNEIRARMNILEIVSEEVILKKSGSTYWGLCPFHREKTPSFSVTPSRGIFKCFGCGVGGDAITFLMKVKNLDFYETIKLLAEKYHVELPEHNHSNKNSKEEKPLMIKACADAVKFYSKQLNLISDTSSVKKYLASREIGEDIINNYSLGLALKESTELYKILKGKYSDNILEKAGLIIKSQQTGKYIDRFRNRLIIPIRDENGDYVAFGARAIEEGQNPKYLNSSDSPIYNKSKLLFGLYNAKESIKEEDAVILMEGYFDVISAQTAGVKNCVASCGTSLTLDHVKLLSKYTRSRRIFLSFDTDTAGINATIRGGSLIKEAFQGLGDVKQFDESHLATNQDKYACEIRVITPPQGKDPDEFIRTAGAEAYKNHVNSAPLLLDFEINNLLKQKSQIQTPLDKSKLIKEIIVVLEQVKNKIIQSEYVKIVAGTLNVNESAILAELNKNRTYSNYNEPNVTKNVTKISKIEEITQKNILSTYLINENPFNFSQIRDMIREVQFTEDKLIIVKNTIDKLIPTVNNVRELTEKLYETFNDDPDSQNIVNDLLSISETFEGLNSKEIQQAIEENNSRLEKQRKIDEYNKLRKEYATANDDEIEALKLQIQLRDKIEELRTGDNK